MNLCKNEMFTYIYKKFKTPFLKHGKLQIHKRGLLWSQKHS